MTDKEKLEKTIAFIKKIERMNIPSYDIEDILSVSGICDECGSEDVAITFRGSSKVFDPKDIEALRDEAWHILADIQE